MAWLVISAGALVSRPVSGGQQSLDEILAVYAAGDHDVVRRAFASSADFQRHRLSDRRRFAGWLGTWQAAKARLALEIIVRAGDVAPAYTLFMLPSGRDYVVNRPSAPGEAPDEDALEQRWHGIALAVLQTRFYDDEIERYLDALSQRRPRATTAMVWPGRADFADAIAQEQRCRVQHVGARHDRLAAAEAFAAATPTADRDLAMTCVERARAKFGRAEAQPESRDEARVRGGWTQFQLGRNEDALQSFASAEVRDDRPLAYWLALFRARTRDAMGALADAEAEYRQALALFPDAQSASVGLALTLFRLNRDDEAETTARVVRQRSLAADDPWDAYSAGDARFVPAWLARLREAHR